MLKKRRETKMPKFVLFQVVWKATTDLGCGVAGGPPPKRVLLMILIVMCQNKILFYVYNRGGGCGNLLAKEGTRGKSKFSQCSPTKELIDISIVIYAYCTNYKSCGSFPRAFSLLVLQALRPCNQRRTTKTELYLLCVYCLFRWTGS